MRTEGGVGWRESEKLASGSNTNLVCIISTLAKSVLLIRRPGLSMVIKSSVKLRAYSITHSHMAAVPKAVLVRPVDHLPYLPLTPIACEPTIVIFTPVCLTQTPRPHLLPISS
jgi:hypothetical protein